MRSPQIFFALIAILFFGLLIRVQAFQWNWFMHGDVTADAMVSSSFLRDGSLLTFPGKDSADPAAYALLPPAADGEQLKLHGPLVPILAAALTAVRGPSTGSGSPTISDAFFSLRILSVLAGMLIILLSLLITCRLSDTTMGLAVAAWTAASYLLIDYSGNGSLYSWQAVVYLLWILVALSRSSWRRTLLLGVIAGLGYLITFQSIILIPAGLLIFASETIIRTRGHTRSHEGLRSGALPPIAIGGYMGFLLHCVVYAIVAILVALPWFIHSQIVFGDPLYSHAYNMGYVYGKAGLNVPEEHLRIGFSDWLGVLHSVFTLWLPNNLYYAARKLFLLAPFAFFLFSFGLIDIAFSPSRLRRSFPLLVVLTLHLLLCAGWPIWKFRFFIALLPLVFILAAEQLHHLTVSRAWKFTCVGVTFSSIVLLSALTYRSVPTHTYYYDGALTQDPFHSSEEETFLRRYHFLPPADAR